MLHALFRQRLGERAAPRVPPGGPGAARGAPGAGTAPGAARGGLAALAGLLERGLLVGALWGAAHRRLWER